MPALQSLILTANTCFKPCCVDCRVGELAAGDVARVLWGLAQLGFAPPQLLAEMGNRLEQPGAWDGFTWPQLAMLTHGLSALGCIPGGQRTHSRG